MEKTSGEGGSRVADPPPNSNKAQTYTEAKGQNWFYQDAYMV